MFSKWCENTSLNGALEWYQSRNSKASFTFWTIIMLSMIALSAYFTYKTVEDFYHQPTTTNSRSEQSTVMQLPEILICYNGGMNVEALMNAGFQFDFIKMLTAVMMENGEIDWDDTQSVDEVLKKYLEVNKMNMRDFLRNFSYSCSDIIVQKPSFATTCNNVTSLYSTLFGRCALFRENDSQLYPGISGGKKFRLKFPSNSFYAFLPNLAIDYDMNNGFYFSFDKHFKWITRRWSLVPANVKAELVLTTQRHIRLPSYKPCDDDKNIYSSNTCFHRCYAEAFYNSCRCQLLEYLDSSPGDTNVTQVCRPSQCVNYDYTLARPCQKRCHPKCDDWVYESSATYSFLEPKKLGNQSESIVWVGYNTMEYLIVNISKK